MRILALIPARGGSKRVPNKNIRELGGKPLINWSIEAVQGIPEIVDILVSTDSPAIADVARAAGALVPWLRPAELSTDTATSIDVCFHALDWYEREKGPVDGLLLLQPTSPFRSRNTIENGIALFRNTGGRTVIGFAPAESHPLWCFHIRNNEIQPFMDWSGVALRSQDLPPAWVISGSFYLADPAILRSQGSYLVKDVVPLPVSDKIESLDIDTELDWALAEVMFAYRQSHEAAA